MSFFESQPIPSSQAKLSSDLTRDFNLTSNRAITATQPKFIQLDFENIKAFEQLRDQYICMGVRFYGAIAIQPSNPAFEPLSGSQVLMPIAHLTGITVKFPHATRGAGAFVIGSKPVALAAFDANNNQVEKISTDINENIGSFNPLSAPLPYHRLEIKSANIVKLVFFSAAPFILDDLFFYQ